jgi:hypothetical protein
MTKISARDSSYVINLSSERVSLRDSYRINLSGFLNYGDDDEAPITLYFVLLVVGTDWKFVVQKQNAQHSHFKYLRRPLPLRLVPQHRDFHFFLQLPAGLA